MSVIPDNESIRRRRVVLKPMKKEYDWLLSKKDPSKMSQKEFEKWRKQNPR